MRAANTALAVVAVLLVVIPLAAFLVVLAGQGLTQAAAWAAIYLLVWLVVLSLIGLGTIGALVLYGLPFVQRKTGSLFAFAQRIAARLEDLGSGVGRKAVGPLLWAYGLGSGVRGVARGLRTARRG